MGIAEKWKSVTVYNPGDLPTIKRENQLVDLNRLVFVKDYLQLSCDIVFFFLVFN